MLTHATFETPGLTGDTLSFGISTSAARYWHFHLERYSVPLKNGSRFLASLLCLPEFILSASHGNLPPPRTENSPVSDQYKPFLPNLW